MAGILDDFKKIDIFEFWTWPMSKHHYFLREIDGDQRSEIRELIVFCAGWAAAGMGSAGGPTLCSKNFL